DAVYQLAWDEAYEKTAALINQPDRTIQTKAAHALMLICNPKRRESLQRLLRHENEEVRFYASLALAFTGDTSGEAHYLSKHTFEGMAAALCAGKEKEPYL